MKRLQPVIWTKGTFLSPQHLQLQDRFLENLLQFHLDSLSFRPWGFRHAANQPGSPGGRSRWASPSASGILPDGLLFDIPGLRRRPAPEAAGRMLRAGPDHARRLPGRSALPRARLERGHRGTRESGARYRAEIELFRDENTGLSEKPVQVARKNLRLLAEGESLDGFSTLRVARVRRTRSRHVPSWIRASCRRCWISPPAITWSRSRAAWWRF